ncbi:unnamed protein product, partial [Mesorhabditis spiculigera]
MSYTVAQHVPSQFTLMAIDGKVPYWILTYPSQVLDRPPNYQEYVINLRPGSFGDRRPMLTVSKLTAAGWAFYEAQKRVAVTHEDKYYLPSNQALITSFHPTSPLATEQAAARLFLMIDNRVDAIQMIPARARRLSWLIRSRIYFYEPPPLISLIMYIFTMILFLLTFPWCLFFCVKVAKEYERVVVFRLGRLIATGTKGPGAFFVLPCIDTCKFVDLRVLTFDVPPQEILSKDSVTVSVEAVIYFRVCNPVVSVTNVNDAIFSTKLLAQTTLRNVLGTKTLSEILAERDAIATITEQVLDEGTVPWGVKVERVEIKDIRLPYQLMKSMATEAEAARDARAAVIAADGEKAASKCLKEAADEICSNKVTMQLRYLQVES